MKHVYQPRFTARRVSRLGCQKTETSEQGIKITILKPGKGMYIIKMREEEINPVIKTCMIQFCILD